MSLEIKDGQGNAKFTKGIGVGTSQDPFVSTNTLEKNIVEKNISITRANSSVTPPDDTVLANSNGDHVFEVTNLVTANGRSAILKKINITIDGFTQLPAGLKLVFFNDTLSATSQSEATKLNVTATDISSNKFIGSETIYEYCTAKEGNNDIYFLYKNETDLVLKANSSSTSVFMTVLFNNGQSPLSGSENFEINLTCEQV